MSEDRNYAEKVKELVEETVDRINEVMDEFGEKAGDIIKEAADSERVEKLVDKILDMRSNIADSTGDIIKSITNAVADTGETITDLLNKGDEDDD